MKILHIVPSLSAEMGGPTEVVINLVHSLRELGVESEIATTNDDVDSVLSVPLGVRTDFRGVPCWFFPRSALRKRQYIFSWEMTSWLWQNVTRYDMLDIHYLFTYSSTCAAAICRARGRPYTLRTIGQLAPWSLSQSAFRKRLYTALIEKYNLNRAGAIHCTTPGEAEDVRRYGVKAPTVVIPLGVTLPAAHPESRAELRRRCGVGPDVPLILFLSRIHPKKRVELLLETLRLLRAKGSPVELAVVGRGEPEYEESLKRLAVELEISAQTHWLGFLQGRDKEIALAGADVFALPSYSENFGIAVAEALAARLPAVITPEIQIAPDLESFDAGMVVPGTAESFAGAIEALLSAPARRAELAKNGLRLVEAKYSWKLAAEHCFGVYSGIIGRHRSHESSSKPPNPTF